MNVFIAYGDECDNGDTKVSVVGVSDEERRTNEICQESINRHQCDHKAYLRETRYYDISDTDANAFFGDVMMRLSANSESFGIGGCLAPLFVALWVIAPVVIIAITIYLTIWPKIAATMGWVR